MIRLPSRILTARARPNKEVHKPHSTVTTKSFPQPKLTRSAVAVAGALPHALLSTRPFAAMAARMFLDEDGAMQFGVPPPPVQDAAQQGGEQPAQNLTSATNGVAALVGDQLAG